jgi:type IV pilus assembly protein PilX
MKHHHSSRAASGQRGVVLLFSLVALVVLLIAAVALMRSFNTSLFMSGNIAFKRDLQNQGERAIDKVLPRFRVGGSLETDAARSADLKASNYSATMLPGNAQGIPDALQSDANFAAVGVVANDISEANEPSLLGQGVKIRYVIDRMATAVGSCTTLGPNVCLMTTDITPAGGSSSQWRTPTRTLSTAPGAAPPVTTGTVVYRLTVRVNGPRDTQAFYQSTFTAP